MSLLLDIGIPTILITLYIILIGWRQATPPRHSLKGAKLIVKAKGSNRIIHMGECFDTTETMAWARKNDGLYFCVNTAKLYWSEGEQAFVERV